MPHSWRIAEPTVGHERSIQLITRREFVAGTSALAIAAALFAASDFGSIHAALAQGAAPANSDLMVAGPLGEQSLGKSDAPVTVIEYASMTCGHCAAFHNQTYPELKKRYIDTGKVRYILREFPLDALAAGAFMLARCAGEGKYFPLVETLFQQQDQWVVQKPIEPLLKIARQAGFSQQSFDACLKDQKMLEGIEWVRNRGSEKFGVNSTPTFFINGQMHRGGLSIDELAKIIDPLVKA
jgi:protein-disulfide isomerase